MTVNKPLADSAPTEQEDQNSVLRARGGDRKALEDLIERHQAWIYNTALRMLFHPQDAEDATQEILVKVVTGLSSFEGRSSFRTWLYRIVANHLLNVKRGPEELKITSFSAYGDALDNTPDLDPPDPNGVSPDGNLLVTEAMLACTSGMLLCLDREQRLGFEAALDTVESQSRDSLRKLCLRNARLHTERFNQNVSRRTDRFGHVVEPHVVESVKSPGFHDSVFRRINFCNVWHVRGTKTRLPPADMVTSAT